MTSELKFATFGDLIGNYILPGMDSVRLEKVRMFHNKREQESFITPHSHRFDLSCYVLEGDVTNTIYERSNDEVEDFYGSGLLLYQGKPGDYTLSEGDISRYKRVRSFYEKGQWYSMTHDQIHSIQFSKGAKVLIFEGPEKSNITEILQPCDDYGIVIPTFKVEEWMFRHV